MECKGRIVSLLKAVFGYPQAKNGFKGFTVR